MEASGLNAGVIRHYHPSKRIRRGLLRGISLLESYQERNDESFLTRAPSLWRVTPDEYRILADMSAFEPEWHRSTENDLPTSFRSSSSDHDRFWITVENDALLDSRELGDLLTWEVEHSSVNVRTNVEVEAGIRTNDHWELTLSDGETFTAKHIVNATGAWANVVGERLGLEPVRMKPVRRHLFLVEAQLVPDSRSYVMDHTNDFVFRRMNQGTLVSYCEDHPSDPGDAFAAPSPEDVQNVIGAAFPDLDLSSIAQTWSGQYAMTPDRKPVLEPDEEEPSVIWATGLNDYGLSYGFHVGETVREFL